MLSRVGVGDITSASYAEYRGVESHTLYFCSMHCINVVYVNLLLLKRLGSTP